MCPTPWNKAFMRWDKFNRMDLRKSVKCWWHAVEMSEHGKLSRHAHLKACTKVMLRWHFVRKNSHQASTIVMSICAATAMLFLILLMETRGVISFGLCACMHLSPLAGPYSSLQCSTYSIISVDLDHKFEDLQILCWIGTWHSGRLLSHQGQSTTAWLNGGVVPCPS